MGTRGNARSGTDDIMCSYSPTEGRVMVAGVGDPAAQCPFDALLCHFGICTPLIHQKCTDSTITPVAKTKALDTVLALMDLQ